jgi:hypothetical protein
MSRQGRSGPHLFQLMAVLHVLLWPVISTGLSVVPLAISTLCALHVPSVLPRKQICITLKHRCRWLLPRDTNDIASHECLSSSGAVWRDGSTPAQLLSHLPRMLGIHFYSSPVGSPQQALTRTHHRGRFHECMLDLWRRPGVVGLVINFLNSPAVEDAMWHRAWIL